MPNPEFSKDDLLEQALKLISLLGWHSFTLVELAKNLDISLAQVYVIFSDKISVLIAFFEKIDLKVLSEINKEDLNEPCRERFFELFMNRFDALAPYKKVLRSVGNGVLSDPASALRLAPKLFHSLRWMAEASGYDVQGFKGYIKINGFAFFYFRILAEWLNNEEEDQAKTMALLDKMITHIEGWLA